MTPAQVKWSSYCKLLGLTALWPWLSREDVNEHSFVRVRCAPFDDSRSQRPISRWNQWHNLPSFRLILIPCLDVWAIAELDVVYEREAQVV
jgi:hypothetical protein